MKKPATQPRRKFPHPARKTASHWRAFAASPCFLGTKAVSEFKILVRLARQLKPQYSTGQ